MGRTLPGSYEVTSRSTAGVAWKADRSTSGHTANRNQGSGPPGDADTLTIVPDRVADDLGWEAIAGVGEGLGRHRTSLAQPAHSSQKPSTWQCRSLVSVHQRPWCGHLAAMRRKTQQLRTSVAETAWLA
jgi:hypothetical protein